MVIDYYSRTLKCYAYGTDYARTDVLRTCLGTHTRVHTYLYKYSYKYS